MTQEYETEAAREFLTKTVEGLVESENLDRVAWEDAIKEAQRLGYDDCLKLVEKGAEKPAIAELIKQIALDWYEQDALNGVQEAIGLLENYARMAQDQELLSRFSVSNTLITKEQMDPAAVAERTKKMNELLKQHGVIGTWQPTQENKVVRVYKKPEEK